MTPAATVNVAEPSAAERVIVAVAPPVRRRNVVGPVLVAALIAALSLSAFSAAYGVDHRPFDGRSASTAAPSVAVDRLVGELEEMGLTCRAEPAMADRVVVQYVAPGGAAVVRLDEAVAALRSGAGSIQRYCF